MCAARSGDAEIVAALLDARADPLARDTHPEFFGDGIWPNERKPQVCKAKRPVGALAGKTVVYHLRLTKCFDKVLKRVFPMTRIAMMRAISAALQSFHNNPALIVAVQQGHSRLAAILLEHSTALGPSTATDSKAAPQPSYWTSATKSGSTGVKERAAALLVACTHRQWRCAEVVLEAGVAAPSLDITRDPSGRTAMHLAAAAGERTTVQLLLKAGASPAIFSCYGRQPLHDACVAGHLSVVRVLIEGKADPSAKAREGNDGFPWGRNDVGKAPLELAEARGHTQLSAYLSTCHKRSDLLASGDRGAL